MNVQYPNYRNVGHYPLPELQKAQGIVQNEIQDLNQQLMDLQRSLGGNPLGDLQTKRTEVARLQTSDDQSALARVQAEVQKLEQGAQQLTEMQNHIQQANTVLQYINSAIQAKQAEDNN